MPEREAQSSGTAVSFQMTFSPYPLLCIAVFPNRRGCCHTSSCAVCGKCRVSSSSEQSLYHCKICAENIKECVHHTAYISSSILKYSLLSIVCFEISTFAKILLNLLSPFHFLNSACVQAFSNTLLVFL